MSAQHGLLLAALGGTAVRSGINWSNAQWPNLMELQVNPDDLQLEAGEPIHLSYYYQDCRDAATITFGLDADTNPYNGNTVGESTRTLGQTGATPQRIIIDDSSLSTTGVASGTYNVAAAITDAGGHTRYAYAPAPVVIGGGTVDTPPTVAIINPAEAASLSGTVLVQAEAFDDHGVSRVEFFVSGTKIGEDSSAADGWSLSWNTTATPNGTYLVTATATDTAGQSGSDSHSVSVSNPALATMHVGDLDGATTAGRKGWTATVTITVHDSAGKALSGALVQGTWSGGYAGTVAVTTGSNGQVQVSTGNIPTKKTSVTFTVNNVTLANYTYDAGSNHDPDLNDSNGTRITILRPGASGKTVVTGASDRLEAMYTDVGRFLAIDDSTTKRHPSNTKSLALQTLDYVFADQP